MDSFSSEKTLVLDYYSALDVAAPGAVAGIIEAHCEDGFQWRGMHPFHERSGAAAVADIFWEPFRAAFRHVQRRQDTFFAGTNDSRQDEGAWVCSMGHLMGLFDAVWLGIPPTGKMAFLRFAEFHRVAEGRIRETALFVDIIGVMLQAGLHPLPPQTGAFFLAPGPRTHDGLLLEPADPAESAKTLELVNRMARELTASGMESPAGELANTWHEDMIWFGPAGIGASYTFERYSKQHQQPFAAHLGGIDFHGHLARIAEGNYAGWFGWPNLTMRNAGGFLGMPASERLLEMRVVDIYRRDGDKLAENWVFIDLLHFLSMQGVDVLERMRSFPRT